ncbi:MAG: dihydroorotase [Alphaproteobacteria bacterium]|nr:dihydroorotase [Alphaproteobacteria bacterium]
MPEKQTAHPTRFSLPRWHDLHAHFRQGGLLHPLLRAHAAMGCAGILAMPNTVPPVAKVFPGGAAFDCWSIEEYLDMLRAAGGGFGDIIVPLYLSAITTPEMVAAGAKSGLLRACKYYPPRGTTNAEHGRPLDHYIQNGVFEAMAEHGVVLCLHGEEHGLPPENYFDSAANAETLFYRKRAPQLVKKFPELKIVAEHVSTGAAVDFVLQAGGNVAASVTPQHLLYTAGHLLQGCRYHLYCLPLLKFDADRASLRAAVADPRNRQFFAGTDSAPHAKKAADCGCAAGCFTGGIAPQLYAMAFEQAGVDLSTPAGQDVFTRFLCRNGPAFYDLPVSKETFTLVKEEQAVMPLATPEGNIVTLAGGAGMKTLPWRIA